MATLLMTVVMMTNHYTGIERSHWGKLKILRGCSRTGSAIIISESAAGVAGDIK